MAAIVVGLLAGGAIAACSSSSSNGGEDPPPDSAPKADTSTPKPDTGTADVQQGVDANTEEDTGTDARYDAAPDAPPIVDSGPDTSPPPDSGLPPEASRWAGPALPAFDEATVAHVRQVRTTGQTKGNRLNVVAKFGDSITASLSFLYEIGNNNYQLGSSYGALESTIAAIRGVTVGGGKNSFNRESSGAKGGWTSGDVLAPTNFVQAEIAALRPGYAIVMFGTNDGNSSDFTLNINAIVQQIEAEGTVAIVSTIPDRKDYPGASELVQELSATVRSMAAQRHLPLIDLFAAFASLPSSGLGSDNIHPSVESTGTSANFTAQYISAYGYNVRNLTAVQMLDRLRALP